MPSSKAVPAGLADASVGWLLLSLGVLLLGLVGPLAQDASPPNRVLKLDGTNSYVELPPNIFNDLTEATVEGWVKWESLRSGFNRFFDYGQAMQDLGVAAYEKDTLWFVMGDSQHQLHSLAIEGLVRTQQWNHIAAVSGLGGMSLYVNGVLVGTNDYQGSFASLKNGTLNRLGKTVTTQGSESDLPFQGQLDEVRVWNVARTEEQIRQAMFQRLTGHEAGLMGLWNFDNGTAEDASLGGHHGKFMGQAHTVASELPTSANLLPRPAFIYGRLLNWRANPGGFASSLTFVRVRQADGHVQTVTLWGDEGYRLALFDSQGSLEVQAFDWWGHRWETNATLRAGDWFQFDLPTDWARPRSAIPSEWLLDALRDPSPLTPELLT